MKYWFILAITLLLAGCAATGPGIEPQQVTVLQKGKTTYADVVRQFGKPSVNSTHMDGTRTAIYLQPGNDEPGAVVSLMSMIAGAATANRESVIFEFDAKGVLIDQRWKQSNPAAAAPAGSAQPTHAVAGNPSNSGTTSSAPRPAGSTPVPAKKRNDGLPSWLPSGNYDPRDPFK